MAVNSKTNVKKNMLKCKVGPKYSFRYLHLNILKYECLSKYIPYPVQAAQKTLCLWIKKSNLLGQDHIRDIILFFLLLVSARTLE
jgi:hypothetical protein